MVGHNKAGQRAISNVMSTDHRGFQFQASVGVT